MGSSDEEVALAVMERLKGKTDREANHLLPVSSGPLVRWRQGNYGMKRATKKKLVAWLTGSEFSPISREAAEKLTVARYLEEFAGQLRREAAERGARGGGSASAPGGMAPSEDMEGNPVGDTEEGEDVA